MMIQIYGYTFNMVKSGRKYLLSCVKVFHLEYKSLDFGIS